MGHMSSTGEAIGLRDEGVCKSDAMKIRAVFLSGRRICRRLAIAALMTPMLALAVPANAQDSPAQQGPPDENSTIGPRELKRFDTRRSSDLDRKSVV